MFHANYFYFIAMKLFNKYFPRQIFLNSSLLFSRDFRLIIMADKCSHMYLLFLVWFSVFAKTYEEIYSSAAELKKLSEMEGGILIAMETYLKQDIERLSNIERYSLNNSLNT